MILFPLILFFILTSLIASNYFILRPASNQYYLTATLNPLSFIVSKRLYSLNSEEKDHIKSVISIEDLTSIRSDYEIPMFHKGKVNRVTSEQYNSFIVTYLKIVSKNLDLFFQNRIKLFIATLGTLKNTFYYDDALLADYPLQKTTMGKFKILKSPVSVGLNKFLNNYIDISKKYSFALWRADWCLILAIICMLLAKVLPYSALISALLLLRITLVFLTSPAALFKYIYSLYLFGFLILPFVLLEYFEYKKRKVENAASTTVVSKSTDYFHD